MLIVHRKIGEELVFTDTVSGNVIRVIIKGRQGTSVSFAVEAPYAVRVSKVEKGSNHARDQQARSAARFDEGINDEPQGTTTR